MAEAAEACNCCRNGRSEASFQFLAPTLQPSQAAGWKETGLIRNSARGMTIQAREEKLESYHVLGH